MANELKNKIPDAEMLLRLEPEELAGVLLPIFRGRQRGATQPINLWNFTNELSQVEEVYPRQYTDRICQAIMESSLGC